MSSAQWIGRAGLKAEVVQLGAPDPCGVHVILLHARGRGGAGGVPARGVGRAQGGGSGKEAA